MFTGLIEKMAACRSLETSGQQAKLVLENPFQDDALVVGESIAVNGACLTLERHDSHALVFHTLAETLRRTNLGALKTDSLVNLERALRLGDRLGGHFVSGHVDATGTILACQRRHDDLELTVTIPDGADFPAVPKGSIAINGVSLTIADLHPGRLTVCLIPHTWKATNLQFARPGALVNLEADLLGKYVRQALAATNARPESRLTLDSLTQAGF